jgi:hypothetical protein
MAKQPGKEKAVTAEQARQLLEMRRQRIRDRYRDDPARQKYALKLFETNPAIQPARRLAGLAPVTTRQQDIENIAKANIKKADERNKSEGLGSYLPQGYKDFADATAAAVQEGLFGVPERIQAASRYYFPGLGTFLGSKLETRRLGSYAETLDLVRAEGELQKAKSLAGNVTGQTAAIIGGGAGAAAAARAGSAGAARLASSDIPKLAQTGNVLQKIGKAATVQKGQLGRNIIRIPATGAVAGAAQAAGEGEDIAEGAAFGAGGAAALGVGAKGAGVLRDNLRQFTRLTSGSIPKALRESITEAPEAILARQQQLSRDTGGRVPLIAALNDADFERASQQIVNRSPESTALAKSQTGKYLRSFMDRMLGHVNNAGRQAGAQITSVGDLAMLRKTTGDDLMAPIANRQLDMTQIELDDIERQVAKEIGSRIRELAPRARKAFDDLNPDDLEKMGLDASDISAARKLMTDWGFGNPVNASVRELDSLRRTLNAAGKSAETSNPANAMAYRSAAKTIGDYISKNVPEYQKVLDTYAAQSRMLEGFETAAAGRRITDIDDVQLQNNLRSKEGRIGMKAGELFRQREAVTARPTSAIAAARNYAAEGNLTRPANLAPDAAQPGTITENLGERAAADLARASRAETDVLDRMIDVNKLNALANDQDATLSAANVGRLAFLSNALPETKIRVGLNILQSLAGKLPTRIAKETAERATDLLFSQDPAKIAQGIEALKKIGFTEKALDVLLRNSAQVSIVGGMQGRNLLSYEEPEAPMPADTEIETPEAVEEPVEALSEEDVYLDSLPAEQLFRMLEEAKAREAENPRNYDDYLDSLPPEELFQMLEDMKAEEAAKENLPPYMRDM